jgi:2-desacetyl-2-hydroxyethyl bacteriochlorophyllide A dehydrogenase
MRAYAIDQFGEAGFVRELPVPSAAHDSVLIRVEAAGVNVFDEYVAKGAMKDYAEHRFPLVPGVDAAGIVVEAGAGASDFKPGDKVMATSFTKPYYGGGTFAELVDVPATAIARRPSNFSAAEAAALPLTGLTALAAVDALDPQAGQQLLVIGATGGVGSFFTQLAARRGVRLIALARPETADYARELGATDVINRIATDLATEVQALTPAGLDAIADFSGDTELIDRLSRLLKAGGKLTTTGTRLDVAAFEARGVSVVTSNEVKTERLAELTSLVESGSLRAPAIRTMPLDRAAEAIAEVSQRHNRGKVVLTTG